MGAVVEREEALDRLGAAGAGLEQGLDGLAQLVEATVGGIAPMARGPVEAVERGGHLKDPASRLQEVAVENFGHVAWLGHDGLSPARAGPVRGPASGPGPRIALSIIPQPGSARKL